MDKERDIDPLISALNLIMQRLASQTGHRFGKNRYFFMDGECGQLGPRLFAYMGFFTSVRPVYKQLMVNVNVCTTAFLQPGNLVDAWKAYTDASMGASADEYLSGAKVATRHLGYKRIKVIRGIGRNKTARVQTFDCQEFGGRITVEEYFKRSTYLLSSLL